MFRSRYFRSRYFAADFFDSAAAPPATGHDTQFHHKRRRGR